METIYFKKVLNPFKAPIKYLKNKYQVFFVIKITKLGENQHPYFSIYGVHGPIYNGNCHGSCGQNIDEFINEENLEYNKGWDKSLYQKLIRFWKKNQLKNVEKDTDYYRELVEKSEDFPEAINECSWNL